MDGTQKVTYSIIIPVFNGFDQTNECLQAMSRFYSDREDVEAIVVDNGSDGLTPAGLEIWKGVMPNLVVVRNNENRGFSGGNNDGLKVARGDYIIFMSNDVVVSGDFTEQVREIIDNTPENVIVGARLIDWDTGWNTYNEEVNPYLEGWFVATSRDVLNTIGWDEAYWPCDMEDIDLAKQAFMNGISLIGAQLPVSHNHAGRTAYRVFGQHGRIAITRKNVEIFKEKWGYK